MMLISAVPANQIKKYSGKDGFIPFGYEMFFRAIRPFDKLRVTIVYLFFDILLCVLCALCLPRRNEMKTGVLCVELFPQQSLRESGILYVSLYFIQKERIAHRLTLMILISTVPEIKLKNIQVKTDLYRLDMRCFLGQLGPSTSSG